ncbi:MAG: bifunctional molybdopterin-guanine dinucleotide biosynthesis adaptor protein MobB/molybdopterin molybdotransferase MoeA [Marinosulfonomonas sp.]|nr:bifunctional molybdopterin-guanine dinucleotide biosynthesis adaptor protein MobB/molybdopterin molybdotransferase MoeA [Marinosulfonomonas sp.]
MKVFGIVGWKNSGKTGLIERLIAEISARGFTVSTVKHAHHSFDVDRPGKDSHRHRIAGAKEVLLASRSRWALMHESGEQSEPPLAELLSKIAPVDLVLIEGYKRDAHAKIEAYRVETGTGLIAAQDTSVVAVAGNGGAVDLVVPVFDLNDTTSISEFILRHVGLLETTQPPSDAPPLQNDCFALPQGVNWMPVDEALDALRRRIQPVVGRKTILASGALGRVLASDVVAKRANPPAANSAVDGYGFAHGVTTDGRQSLPLLKGRAAPGAPFADTVPVGQAVRILTGALLPTGVDTVVLQEDVKIVGETVQFDGLIKPKANARNAGEDIHAGQMALNSGQVLHPGDIALLSAVGCDQVSVFTRLRVGVLSTGDELVEPGRQAPAEKTYDANRPMLLSLVEKWGYDPVDLGHATDSRAALQDKLDYGAENADVILTSGGASVGDEDHVSALLKDAGALSSWRIAIKPGRPLAMGVWNGVPIFGLPGNPVAAFVCTLIFGRPAMSVLAGGGWLKPQGFTLPAAFEKDKKAGRREYLRARVTPDGRAEVFASEGSGRVSGLSWADGLVELEDAERRIQPGDPVRYIPYSSFGI